MLSIVHSSSTSINEHTFGLPTSRKCPKLCPQSLEPDDLHTSLASSLELHDDLVITIAEPTWSTLTPLHETQVKQPQVKLYEDNLCFNVPNTHENWFFSSDNHMPKENLNMCEQSKENTHVTITSPECEKITFTHARKKINFIPYG